MYRTQILSQSEFRAEKNKYSKAGKGFLQGFWFYCVTGRAGCSSEVAHEESLPLMPPHRAVAVSEPPGAADWDSVRARSRPRSRLLLGPQKQEDERWHLLLGNEAPPSGCDSGSHRRKPRASLPTSVSTSQCWNRSAPRPSPKDSAKYSFGLRTLSTDGEGDPSRRTVPSIASLSLPPQLRSCHSTSSVFLSLLFFLLTSVPATRVWPSAISPFTYRGIFIISDFSLVFLFLTDYL